MPEPFDVDKVLALMSNKGVKQNSDSIMGMLEQGNQVLAEFEKTCKTLENMHVLPAIVRAVGAKYEIDVDTPLAGGLKPATDYHKVVFERLNAMSEADIGVILSGGKSESPKPNNPGHDDK